jgi:hypothetical protein
LFLSLHFLVRGFARDGLLELDLLKLLTRLPPQLIPEQVPLGAGGGPVPTVPRARPVEFHPPVLGRGARQASQRIAVAPRDIDVRRRVVAVHLAAARGDLALHELDPLRGKLVLARLAHAHAAPRALADAVAVPVAGHDVAQVDLAVLAVPHKRPHEADDDEAEDGRKADVQRGAAGQRRGGLVVDGRVGHQDRGAVDDLARHTARVQGRHLHRDIRG